MKINYIKGDLFTSPVKVFAHCISADFELGKGIATEFRDRFEMKKYLDVVKGKFSKGTTVYVRHKDVDVFNLVTKEKYWQKPTYNDLIESLIEMRILAKNKNIHEIAMPKIGCGLDKLKWEKVEEILNTVFKDTDVILNIYER